MINTITDLIPQRSPFIFVDNIFNIEENSFETCFTVPVDGILVKNSCLTESAIVEHVAQSMAAYMGYTNKSCPIRIGVLGAIKHFIIYQKPHTGDILHTKIVILNRVFSTILLHAKVQQDQTLLAEGEMKVVVL